MQIRNWQKKKYEDAAYTPGNLRSQFDFYLL
jgi:hypothetical protein